MKHKTRINQIYRLSQLTRAEILKHAYSESKIETERMKLLGILMSTVLASPTSLDMSEMTDPMEINFAQQFDGYNNMVNLIVQSFGTYFETENLPSEPTMQSIKFSRDLIDTHQDFTISMVESLHTKLQADAYEAAVDYVMDLKKGRQSRTYCDRLVNRSGLIDLLIADEHGIEVDIDDVTVSMGCLNGQIVAKGQTAESGYSLSLLDGDNNHLNL